MATTYHIIVGMLGGWEIVLILAVVLFLFLVRMSTGPPSRDAGNIPRFSQADFLLWIAEGFGVGRIPFAPGTFGAVVGLLWFGFLVATQSLWWLLAGTITGVAFSVWLCGAGEKVLKETDPGSVVLDEIAAVPLCFFAWIGIVMFKGGALPGLEDFFGSHGWLLTLGVFAAFRFFDVLKPWPVRQSQSLPGGWGITIDDLLAAVYVNVIVLVIYFGRTLLMSH